MDISLLIVSVILGCWFTPKIIHMNGLSFPRPPDLHAPLKIPEELGIDALHPLKLRTEGKFNAIVLCVIWMFSGSQLDR